MRTLKLLRERLGNKTQKTQDLLAVLEAIQQNITKKFNVLPHTWCDFFFFFSFVIPKILQTVLQKELVLGRTSALSGRKVGYNSLRSCHPHAVLELLSLKHRPH